MRITDAVLAVSAAALMFAGCSDSEAPEPTPTARNVVSATVEVVRLSDGIVATTSLPAEYPAEIPAPPTSELTSALHYREQVRAFLVTWESASTLDDIERSFSAAGLSKVGPSPLPGGTYTLFQGLGWDVHVSRPRVDSVEFFVLETAP